MSHAIYQSPAFILKTKASREANKVIYLYTKRFGLIYAQAQSSRKLSSKMRYHLQEYSIVDLDLVRGKNIWHITGVSERDSIFSHLGKKEYRLITLLSDVLRRLCVGEEENLALWQEIEFFFQNLQEDDFLEDVYEIIIMVRILFHLGYWKNQNDLILRERNPYQKKIEEKILQAKKDYIHKINESLQISQL